MDMKDILETERSAKGTVRLATVVESSCQKSMRQVSDHTGRSAEAPIKPTLACMQCSQRQRLAAVWPA